jgi:hypothetical protein
VIRLSGNPVNRLDDDYINVGGGELVHCFGARKKLAFVGCDILRLNGIKRDTKHIILAYITFTAIEIIKKMFKSFA